MENLVNKKLLSVRLDSDLIRRLKTVAAVKGITLTEVITKALEKVKAAHI